VTWFDANHAPAAPTKAPAEETPCDC